MPSRYAIDFGERDVIEARTFRLAFDRLEKAVLPEVEAKSKAEEAVNQDLLKKDRKAKLTASHKHTLGKWWLFHRRRPEMISKISQMERYIVCPEVSKRPIFEFVSNAIHPDNKLIVFTFEDDYSFGILQSNQHWEWWLARGATLSDTPAYTPNTVFDTFPWPQHPAPAQVKAVAEAGRALHEYRRGAMTRNPKLTLRELYRSLELPGKNPLKDLHAALDAAVLAAYAFPPPSESPLPSPLGQGVGGGDTPFSGVGFLRIRHHTA
jgi:hypothetical protein